MWRHALRPRRADERDRLVITPHHPDRLRRPQVSVAGSFDDRLEQALLWNVFRTLELITPSFWLRRLHARLTGEPPPVPAHIARVRLWPHLPLPPMQCLDGHRADVIVDVVIETEHAVWTLVLEARHDDLADGEHAAAVVDAGAWFAAPRAHYCGVIEGSGGDGLRAAVLQRRFARSRESVRLQSATRGAAAPARATWGALSWPDLAAVLRDCCEATSLPPVERMLARHAVTWLRDVGVSD
jgi:hypothetical protein